MGRELGLSPETSKRWLGILGATFQWYEHPPFCTNINKRLSTKPKGYIADTGIACAGQAISTPHALGGHPLWGALFESAVIGDIRKQCAILAPPPRFYHWRTHGGAEVDLLVERDGIFFPVEIKGAAQVTRRDASGIDAFRQTYPNLRIAKGLVIGPIESVYPLSHSAIAVPWDLAG
jgi:predicted AAA+ superfamily ATPase